MGTIFFTGFPGFLGSELLPRVLKRAPGDNALCLVQPKFATLSRERIGELEARHPEIRGRIGLAEGDITQPGLGLAEGSAINVREIYHLAAIYDLSVKREVGMRVNVDGTKNILSFAKTFPQLERLHYVSTCYVSGRHPGLFTENDLEKNQTFNNYYEETKYLAELEVQRAMREGLPATIYRPSVVVGDSRTGATQKYDGPYFVMRWLLKQPRVAILPVVGSPKNYHFNVVPRDYVVEAIAKLSGMAESKGKVYQLADPDPLTVDGIIRVIGRAANRAVLRIPLPIGVAKGSIDHVPGVYRLMQIPSSAVDYFVHPTEYRNENATADLAGSGIEIPHFDAYVDRLVEFVLLHPQISSAAMS